MATLWEISADLAALNELAQEQDGELDAVLEQWFAEIGDDLNTKIDGYVNWITMMRELAKARAHEAFRLEEMARTVRAAANRCEARLLEFLQAHNIKKLQTRRHLIWLQTNGGKEPITIDRDQLPANYWTERVIREPNDDLIRKFMHTGAVPGVTVLERGCHLRIK